MISDETGSMGTTTISICLFKMTSQHLVQLQENLKLSLFHHLLYLQSGSQIFGDSEDDTHAV